MEANLGPAESSQCPAPATKRPESPPSAKASGNCSVFWFVMDREEPVRFELHRLGDGTRKVKYGDNAWSGHWILGNSGHKDDENVFVCHFDMAGFGARDYHFVQVEKSVMYCYRATRQQYNAVLVFLPEESW